MGPFISSFLSQECSSNYIITHTPCLLHFRHDILAGWMMGGAIVNSVVATVFQRLRRARKAKTGDNVESFIIM